MFIMFILSIPAVLLAALYFDEFGGQILAGWFAVTTGLIGLAALKKFFLDRDGHWVTVDGRVVEIESATRYSSRSESMGGRTTYYTPIIEYGFRGKRYQKAALVSKNDLALKLTGPRLGGKVKMRVPVASPTEAVEDTFLGRNVHLLIGVFLLCFSGGLFWLLTGG